MDSDDSRRRSEEGRDQSHDGRDETPEARADRKWGDLIQEVRVAQTGVQILFGFLLTVAFTPLFHQLGHADKAIYVCTVVLGSATTGALVAPVSFHRLLAGRHIKPTAVAWASRLTVVGLVLLLATMTSSLILVLRVASHGGYWPWLVALVVAWYLVCWFALPLWVRHWHTDKQRR
ncbi:DUF6328 family protein [Streptomyces sp. NPDC058301]|uniref:DUF6328 family protein n=1 Tax=Streptomyces sp. NPDC058301 TaxID=3346436 RepID=UPI0036EDE9A5